MKTKENGKPCIENGDCRKEKQEGGGREGGGEGAVLRRKNDCKWH